MSEPPDEVAQSLVLNGLVDIVDERDKVFADDVSAALLRETYESVTTDADRDGFQQAVANWDRDSGTDGVEDELLGIAAQVVERLAASDFHLTVDHLADIPLPKRQVSTYSFLHDPSVGAVGTLSLSAEVEGIVTAGTEGIERGAYDETADRFEAAVSRCDGGDESVTTRVLAAWATHRDGDDERAIELVREALEIDDEAWDAMSVGIAADHPDSDRFRDDELSVRPFLRWIADVPEGATIVPSVGYPDNEEFEWRSLTEGTPDCTPVDRLKSEMQLRLEIESELPSFPAIHGYYLGIGVVDPSGPEARTIDHVLASGPVTIDSTDLLSLSQ